MLLLLLDEAACFCLSVVMQCEQVARPGRLGILLMHAADLIKLGVSSHRWSGATFPVQFYRQPTMKCLLFAGACHLRAQICYEYTDAANCQMRCVLLCGLVSGSQQKDDDLRAV